MSLSKQEWSYRKHGACERMDIVLFDVSLKEELFTVALLMTMGLLPSLFGFNELITLVLACPLAPHCCCRNMML